MWVGGLPNTLAPGLRGLSKLGALQVAGWTSAVMPRMPCTSHPPRAFVWAWPEFELVPGLGLHTFQVPLFSQDSPGIAESTLASDLIPECLFPPPASPAAQLGELDELALALAEEPSGSRTIVSGRGSFLPKRRRWMGTTPQCCQLHSSSCCRHLPTYWYSCSLGPL